MKIAIDASPAFKHLRTGIEEYSYQLIKHLRPHLKDHQVTLYIRGGTKENVDFALPPQWRVKVLRSPKFWTYFRLSLEFVFRKYDRFFVPGHIVPPIHPKNTVMVVHGLEFEMSPESFSHKEQRSMRYGIQKSCSWAKYIICVSNNTKRDLMDLYQIPKKKIRVIYEGVNRPLKNTDHEVSYVLSKYSLQKGGFLFFVGRVEYRKNIIGILKAYEILRDHFRIQHKLVLSGKGGYGISEIEELISMHPYKQDIVVTGFVEDYEKWALLRNSAVFLFPTLYEGFGLPVLEAQQVGIPVVTSKTSSLGEIAGDSAQLVDPQNYAQIAEKTYEVLSDEAIYHATVKAGYENTKRFSWKKAAELSSRVILAGQSGEKMRRN